MGGLQSSDAELALQQGKENWLGADVVRFLAEAGKVQELLSEAFSKSVKDEVSGWKFQNR